MILRRDNLSNADSIVVRRYDVAPCSSNLHARSCAQVSLCPKPYIVRPYIVVSVQDEHVRLWVEGPLLFSMVIV